MKPACRIVVMAKAPVPGQAKTRLIPRLGADGAARLAERMLIGTVEQAIAACIGPVELCCAPDASHTGFVQLATRHRLQLASQGSGDIGARMARAIERGLQAGDRVIVIGTDIPALDAAYLRRALAALDDCDAVFGPAADGGYVLVGLRRPAPLLFADMPWGTAAVMRETRERLARCGLSHAELPTLHDIDEPADLVHLPAAWTGDPP